MPTRRNFCAYWIFTLTAVLLVPMTAQVVRADDTPSASTAQTYKVQEGSFPWYDRENVWALTKVPDSLKSNDPVPQQSCSSRSLDIGGSPKSILIGVAEFDVDAFKGKVPTAKATGDTVSIKNSTGTVISYTVFSLDNPPAKIDGTGVYHAGLILLKVVPGQASK